MTNKRDHLGSVFMHTFLCLQSLDSKRKRDIISVWRDLNKGLYMFLLRMKAGIAQCKKKKKTRTFVMQSPTQHFIFLSMSTTFLQDHFMSSLLWTYTKICGFFPYIFIRDTGWKYIKVKWKFLISCLIFISHSVNCSTEDVATHN